MGSGEFIPNGSVYWDIEEEDVSANGGNVNRGKTRPNLRGRDPIANAHVGKGKKKGGDHAGALRVVLRFTAQAQVRPALEAAINSMQDLGNGLFEVEIVVPVRNTTTAEAKLDSPNPWAQARVEW
jgi:hypothetical protein